MGKLRCVKFGPWAETFLGPPPLMKLSPLLFGPTMAHIKGVLKGPILVFLLLLFEASSSRYLEATAEICSILLLT